MNPFISIIVPVYNAEETLNRCIDSIINQTYTNWELLLINDGSNDNSGNICDEYVTRDKRIKVFHKNNEGASSARNLGLDNVSGDWITFCDSDDFVYPEWLNNYVENISDDIELICQGFECDKILIDELKDTRIFGLNYKGDVKEGVLQLNKIYSLGYTVVKLFRRNIIESNKLRFDVSYNYWEDQEFCFKYFSCIKNIVCTDKVGYFYFLPNWKQKYHNKNNMFYLYKSLYNSLIKLFDGENNDMVVKFLDDYIAVVLALYKEKNKSGKKYLKNFRDIVGKNIMKSHLFFFTKLAIYIDKTSYFSDMVLKLHIKLK